MTHTSPPFFGERDGKVYKVGVVDKGEEGFWALYRALRRFSSPTRDCGTKNDRLAKRLSFHFPTLVQEGWSVQDTFHLHNSLQLLFTKSKPST